MNNNKPTLQFTELTPDDIDGHENLYINLLVGNGIDFLDKRYSNAHREYAIDEVQKAKQLFQNTFG